LSPSTADFKALRRIQRTKETLDQERCRRDAHYFVFESGLVTKDEHDQATPIKAFPKVLYLQSLLDALLVSGRLRQPSDCECAIRAGHSGLWLQALAASGLLMVEKSRQVMATWLCCAYLLWRAKYHDHQLILIQSKREDDAANLVFNKESFVGRISFMESHLPAHLRTLTFPKGATFAHLFFPNGSHIWGIPEGADIIRSNTPSVVFSDEAAFQPAFGSAVTAALPAIKGGGQYIAVSSAEPGEFASLVEAA
jgi:hypothetical protein